MSFPVGLLTITVTGLNVLSLGGEPLNGSVIFSASGPIADPAASAVVEGAAIARVVNGVMTPVILACTDAVSPGFTYDIAFRLDTDDGASPPPSVGVAIPHTLGATVDLSALI